TALLLAFDEFARLVVMDRTGGDGKGRCDIPSRSWRAMLLENVTGVVMAHNHPSGTPWPSAADFAATREAAHLLRLLEIELVDHQIFVGNGHFSFRKAGLL
ncbi:MAG: DNA repair protein RadC, partial [Alphaproteobacteria bacterium HGW-Alphaproteobacteria-13]